MAVDLTRINGACLDKFGQALTFTPAETGVPQTITGILRAAAQPEELAPGESVHMLVWIVPSNITPEPVPGDEIATATTVYKMLLPGRDEEGGCWWQLRKDRDL